MTAAAQNKGQSEKEIKPPHRPMRWLFCVGMGDKLPRRRHQPTQNYDNTIKSVVRSLGSKKQEDTEVPSCFLNADKNQKFLMISTISEPMRF